MCKKVQEIHSCGCLKGGSWSYADCVRYNQTLMLEERVANRKQQGHSTEGDENAIRANEVLCEDERNKPVLGRVLNYPCNFHRNLDDYKKKMLEHRSKMQGPDKDGEGSGPGENVA